MPRPLSVDEGYARLAPVSITATRGICMTSSSEQLVEGQATYGMADLRSERTGLPFIVFISQRDDARHAARVKVSPHPKVAKDRIGSYSVSPVAHKAGARLSGPHERRLVLWIELNRAVLEAYWDGEIEYTEDALARLRPVPGSADGGNT